MRRGLRAERRLLRACGQVRLPPRRPLPSSGRRVVPRARLHASLPLRPRRHGDVRAAAVPARASVRPARRRAPVLARRTRQLRPRGARTRARLRWPRAHAAPASALPFWALPPPAGPQRKPGALWLQPRRGPRWGWAAQPAPQHLRAPSATTPLPCRRHHGWGISGPTWLPGTLYVLAWSRPPVPALFLPTGHRLHPGWGCAVL